NNIPALQMRGLMLKMLGETKQAMEDLSKAIEYGSTEPLVYIERAYLYIVDERLDDALKDAERAITFGEELASAYFARGNVRFMKFFKNKKESELEKAIQDFTEAIKLDSNNIESVCSKAYHGRGLSYI